LIIDKTQLTLEVIINEKLIFCYEQKNIPTFYFLLVIIKKIFQINMEIFVIYILLFGSVFGADEVLELNQGKLTGSSMRTRNGREFKAFQGIPYAKSPTGDLRFKVNLIEYYFVS